VRRVAARAIGVRVAGTIGVARRARDRACAAVGRVVDRMTRLARMLRVVLRVTARAALRRAHVVLIVTAGAAAMLALARAEHALRRMTARARGGLRLGEAMRRVAARARLVAALPQRARQLLRMTLDAARVGGAGALVRLVAVEALLRAAHGAVLRALA